MQTYTSVGVRALGAVLQIALYRTTDRCQLTPYLMMPSGLEIDLQERIVLAANKGFVLQNRLLRVLGVRFGYITLVLCFVSHQPVFESCFGLFGSALDDRPIRLFYIVFCLLTFDFRLFLRMISRRRFFPSTLL